MYALLAVSVFWHFIFGAACENPQIVEMLDGCTKGLKLPAQVEVQ